MLSTSEWPIWRNLSGDMSAGDERATFLAGAFADFLLGDFLGAAIFDFGTAGWEAGAGTVSADKNIVQNGLGLRGLLCA